MIKYLKLLIALSLASSRYITEAAVLEPTKATACDFLQGLEGSILPTSTYYENDSYMLQQHKSCLEDTSDEADDIRDLHDTKTMSTLRKANKDKITISIFGGSTMTECDPNWGSAVRIGHEFENVGYRVLQGGGAGLMMALRIGSDLFCRSLEEVGHVVALMCEAKTASSDRQQEIKTLITEQYTTCKPQHSHSIHGAFWMTRMPAKPYIGFGAERTEVYDIYKVLSAMARQADIWIAAPGSSGTVLEYDAALVQADYRSYLSPDKKQHLIVFNATHWESNEQVHTKRLHRADIQHASTAEEVIEKTNTIVRQTLCSKQSALQTCSALMYRQPRIMEQEVMIEKLSSNI
jgi:predicted Rossmann-fold nucleotide-binding protein